MQCINYEVVAADDFTGALEKSAFKKGDLVKVTEVRPIANQKQPGHPQTWSVFISVKEKGAFVTKEVRDGIHRCGYGSCDRAAVVIQSGVYLCNVHKG